MAKFQHIAVDGPIGVGKSSLAELLAERLGAQKIFETTQNPFLRDFYEEKDEESNFLVQLFFLLNRTQQQKNIRQQPLFQKATVCDYLFEKDKIFAYLNLSDHELLVYETLYNMLSQDLPEPDLVIYLQAHDDVLIRRIKQRGRDYEKKISPEYIRAVNEAYNRFFFNYNRTPLLVINTTDSDFVHHRDTLDDLVNEIESMDHGTRYYTPLGVSGK